MAFETIVPPMKAKTGVFKIMSSPSRGGGMPPRHFHA